MKWFDANNPLYPNGAELSYHPFLDSQAFYGISRRSPAFLAPNLAPVEIQNPECYCAFCMGRLVDATPEKSRTIFQKGTTTRVAYPQLEENPDTLFRRQGNLFEIVSFEFWKSRYGIDSHASELLAIEEHLSSPQLKSYLYELVQLKFARTLRAHTLNNDNIVENLKPFFSGFHELLTSGRHFNPNPQTRSDLFTSGTMSWQEHRISYEDIILIHDAMLIKNPHIKYISTFQNWLALAGASFEHWHKQILATDFWGKPLLRERDSFAKEADIYTQFAVHTAVDNNLVIAENEHALCCLEVGGKTGLISIISKSSNLHPHRHQLEEIHGMSDMVHAVCKAIGSATPYNEEWFYTPFDAEDFRTPWRVIINLRSGTEAGFENINQYLVSTVSQIELAETLRNRIADLPDISPSVQACLACENHKNCLQY
ncbi:MAG: DUF4921 family protein [Brevinema sp.]